MFGVCQNGQLEPGLHRGHNPAQLQIAEMAANEQAAALGRDLPEDRIEAAKLDRSCVEQPAPQEQLVEKALGESSEVAYYPESPRHSTGANSQRCHPAQVIPRCRASRGFGDYVP
jgi:hypothetical protein